MSLMSGLSSLVDGRFYKVVGSDAPEFAAICAAMQAESSQHIIRIHAVYNTKNKATQPIDPWSTNKN